MTGARLALVTGGAGGIGFATVELLARQGYRVALADLGDTGVAAMARLPAGVGQVFPISLDVTDRAGCAAVLRRTGERDGPVSAVVNCAGIAGRSRLGDAGSAERWDRTLAVNLTGSYNVVAACLDQLKADGRGAVVNISSVVGLRTGSAEIGYVVSKGGIVAMTRQLGRELAPFGIRVNAVAPGYIETPLLLGDRTEVTAWLDMHCPMKRLGQPAEVAAAIAFLLSDAASYVTGVVLPVDGGYVSV